MEKSKAILHTFSTFSKDTYNSVSIYKIEILPEFSDQESF